MCLDQDSYDVLNRLNSDHIVPLNIDDLESLDEELSVIKNNRKVIGAPDKKSYTEYCWCLTPYIIWFILNTRNDIDSITYCDSDIYFHNSYNIIYDEIGDRSVGIFRHRHVPHGSRNRVGEYNVGTLFFRNDEVGRECSKWWKTTVFDQENEYFKSHGTCGDQKYLELFGELHGNSNIAVVEETVGHLAPWNARLYEYLEDDMNYIVWGDKKQLVVFSHFSHFTPDFKSRTYKDSWDGEWGRDLSSRPTIKRYYDIYFDNMIAVRELVEKNIGVKLQ